MEYKKQFLKIYENLARHHGRHRVFDDFVSLASIELSQTARKTFGLEKDEQDEKCYMDIVKRYGPDEMRGPFVELFAATIFGLEHEKGDWLGCIYEELELDNDALGQFFTPYHVSKLMGNMICGDKTMLQSEINRKGFVTFTEPTCGSGGMVLAFAESFLEAGFDIATQLFAVAQDISSTAACMCHIVEAVGAQWKGKSGSLPHVPEMWVRVCPVQTPSGLQEMICLNELGLYFYLNRSDKPAALPWQIIVAEILREFRLHESASPEVVYRLQRENNLLTVEKENLLEEVILLKRKLRMFRGGIGTFTLREVAIHLMQNELGDGNVDKLVRKMVKHGLLQKDRSAKKQALYWPFLKDIRNGYFDARLDASNDPIPVIQSNLVVTLAGLNWITSEFQKIESSEYALNPTLFRYSDYLQYRLSFLSEPTMLPANVR